MKKREYKLYNLIFPIWLLWLFPVTWLIVLPANFLIDLLVVVLTMRYLHVPDVRKSAGSVILHTWICGFAADFVGTFCMFLVNIPDFSVDTPFGRWWYDNLVHSVCYNPLENIWGVLWTTVCVVITGVVIYLLNVKYFRKKLELEEIQRKKLALSLAVFTAPYLFYLPTAWFY